MRPVTDRQSCGFFSQSVQFYTDPDGQVGRCWNDRAAPSQSVPMLSAHIASFLKLISAQLEETSHGIRSIHHIHNVHCGITNILSLLEHNNDVVEKADQLSRRASNYITHRDPVSATVGDVYSSEDTARLQAAHAALAGFRFAVEHSRPNSRVHTLGLA